MTDLQFVLSYALIAAGVLILPKVVATYLTEARKAKIAAGREEAMLRYGANRVIQAAQAPVLPLDKMSPLMQRAQEITEQLQKLYNDGAAQGQFLELSIGPFDGEHIETMKMPLIKVTWRLASTLDDKGARMLINPVTPGK